jgi:hypothetical protein
MGDTGPSTTEIVIQVAIAVGTLAVAVLAIWGEWFRAKLAPPKLKIVPHTPEGSLTRFTDGPRVYFYHLRVVNDRPWAVAKNCRVFLRALYKRCPDQQFHPLPFAVPLQYVWSPAETTPTVLNISKDQVLDFGRLPEDADRFTPVLYSYSNNFQGYLGAGEAIRYALEVVGDGFGWRRYQVFEVAWDGQWYDSKEEMSRHLVIKEVKQ